MGNLTGTTIIFDLDGTFVDTAPDLIRAMNAVLRKAGVAELPGDTVRHLVGHGARSLIERGFAEAGYKVRDEQEMLDWVAFFVEYYEAHIADQSVPFPGALNLIDQLKAAGAKTAICTNKNERLTHALLPALGLIPLFDAVVCGDTLEVAKPNAAPLMEAARRAGAEQFLMVGDTETDINAAINAKAPSLAVSFGYSATDARDLGASAVIDHFDDAFDVITHLMA